MADAMLLAALAQYQTGEHGKLACAVSGGSDSLALMYLLHEALGPSFAVFHFDHRLRPESGEEARWVAKQCDALGISCHISYWDQPETEVGNKLQSARVARYRAFADLCETYEIDKVLVAHTRDDVAETLLMRLSKGSGVTGLAEMARHATIEGVTVERPLLDISREALQNDLTARGITWLNDPSNDDRRYQRVRIRQHKQALATLGLDFDTIAVSARALRRADDALDTWIDQLEKHCLTVSSQGEVKLAGWQNYPLEVQYRLFIRVIARLSGCQLPVRTTKLSSLINGLTTGETRTLAGVQFTPKTGYILCKLQ